MCPTHLLHFLCFQIDFLSEIEGGFLFDFWSFVFVFSNLASLSSHLSSHLLHVKSGQVDFFTFKISTYDLLLIPILWWNYASSHLFSIFFPLFLDTFTRYFKVFFFSLSFQYLVHLNDICFLLFVLDFHHIVQSLDIPKIFLLNIRYCK